MDEKQLRILLVEDDQMFRDILRTRFQSRGVNIITAANGSAAIAAVEGETSFDVILLDIALPDMDGFEVLSRVRQAPALAATPVIVVSNFVRDQDIDWGRKLGAVQFIQKSSVMPGEIVDLAIDTGGRAAGTAATKPPEGSADSPAA